MESSKKGVVDKLWLPKAVSEKYKPKYICLWQDEEGKVIGLPTGEFLCAESWTPNNKEVETKMRAAAKAFGVEGGNPVWRPGRKVSNMEADDQMERYLDGQIPDEQEAYLAGMEEEYLKSQGKEHPK